MRFLRSSFPSIVENEGLTLSSADYAILALHILPADRKALRTVIFPVVLFIAMSSTIVHVRRLPDFSSLPTLTLFASPGYLHSAQPGRSRRAEANQVNPQPR